MFADIDRMDAHAFSSYLAPDAVMRIGNGQPVHGRERCRAEMIAFYDRIRGLQHELIDQWEHGAATIAEWSVTFTRPDGTPITVPMVTIYRTDEQDLVSDYRVYADLGPVLRPTG